MTKGIVYAVYHQGVTFCSCFYELDDAMEFCKRKIKEFWEHIYDHEVDQFLVKRLECKKWLIGHISNLNDPDYDYLIKTIHVK